MERVQILAPGIIATTSLTASTRTANAVADDVSRGHGWGRWGVISSTTHVRMMKLMMELVQTVGVAGMALKTLVPCMTARGFQQVLLPAQGFQIRGDDEVTHT